MSEAAYRGTAQSQTPAIARDDARLFGLGGRERPLAETVSAEEIDDRAADGDCDGSGKAFEEAAAAFCVSAARIEEHEGEAGHGDERREGIEGNAEGAREIGAADAEKNHSNLLK